MVIQGESGLMDVTGFPETGPTKVGVAITDCLAALYAVQGILLAHIQRERTGTGQFLDIALLDSAVSVLGLPVCRRVRLVGRQRWMCVAEAPGTLTGGCDDADGQAEHGHGRIEQRDVEGLP